MGEDLRAMEGFPAEVGLLDPEDAYARGVEYSMSRGAWEQGGPWNPPTPLPVLIDTASAGSFFQA